ncbi:hypothetical protein HOLleu_22141 [Holothuria leucospilota]|uniref:Uncharacterized protein n=1 Tax=Holothuria leucospilota TaxID=206669 RepID=A0A9Q1H6K1_HOLLE|nr:hypothetical protein HOLleu_22141 [Holothuria leucospilota]
MEHRSAESWDISIALDYNILNSCGAKAILHCMAEGTTQVLQETVSTVEINSGPCNLPETTDNPADQDITRAGTSAKTSPVLIVFIVLVLIVIVVVLIMCCVFCHKHRGLHDEINTKQQSDRDLQLLPMGSPSFKCVAFKHETTDANGNTTTISGGFVAFGGQEGVASSKILALE